MPTRLLSVFTVALTAAMLWSTPPLTQDADTWTGEVVDVACYVVKGVKGDANRKCGLTSVKNGQPMGLLTDDGTLVLLVRDPKANAAYQGLKDRVGRRAQVTGTLAEKDGMKVVTVTGSQNAD